MKYLHHALNRMARQCRCNAMCPVYWKHGRKGGVGISDFNINQTNGMRK
jgi:hypothetical protein